MIQEALYTHLSGVATGGIHASILPQVPTYPALTYRLDGASRQKRFCGTDSLVRSSFQIDAYHKTAIGARDCALAVKAALIDFRGQMGASPSVYVSDVALDNEFDLSELEPGLYRISMNFGIWHAGL